MFLVDDIATFPVKSILSLFREIYKAAVQEMAEEAEKLRAELSRLYQQLEAGALDEAEFDAREQEILDRLDAIEARDELEDDEDEGDEEESDDEDSEEDDEVDDDLDEEELDDESEDDD